MKINSPAALLYSSLLVSSLFFVSCSSQSKISPDDQAAKKSAPPSAEEIERNMKEASTPGKEHEVLKQLAGNWSHESKFWMDPAGSPEVSKGKAVFKSIYGGRYLSSTYKGTAMGQPFEGQGIIGFDNVGKKFFSTWIDSMNTMFMISEGSISADNKVLTFRSTMTCPMSRQPITSEDVITIVDKNNFKYEMFELAGAERKRHLEILYKRAK